MLGTPGTCRARAGQTYLLGSSGIGAYCSPLSFGLILAWEIDGESLDLPREQVAMTVRRGSVNKSKHHGKVKRRLEVKRAQALMHSESGSSVI